MATHGKCTLISCNLNNTVKQEVPKEAKSQSIAAQAAGIKAPHLGSASRFSRPKRSCFRNVHACPGLFPCFLPYGRDGGGGEIRSNLVCNCLKRCTSIEFQWLNDHPLRSEHHQIIIQCPSSVHPVSIHSPSSVHPLECTVPCCPSAVTAFTGVISVLPEGVAW